MKIIFETAVDLGNGWIANVTAYDDGDINLDLDSRSDGILTAAAATRLAIALAAATHAATAD